MSAKTLPKVVVLGGGTGSFTLLSSLKEQPIDITAIVNMVDDGGSTGKLRDELGALPPGDVRQCLVALSDAPDYLRELFNYRFEEGDLNGHSFGNLFLSALEKMNDSFDDSVELASKILNVRGRVVPVTLDDTVLEMEVEGKRVVGQASIELTEFSGQDKKPDLSLRPPAKLNPKALQAISKADLIVIAPGNLYCSLVPVLLPVGISDALNAADAPTVMVSNLVNKQFHTNGFGVSDYLEVIESVIGKGVISHLIYNNAAPPEGLLEKYSNSGELPANDDTAKLDRDDIQLIGTSLISSSPVEHKKGSDELMVAKRNYIRHDADKTAELIMEILSSE